MTSYAIQTVQSFNQDSLATPTATKANEIALGSILTVVDSSAQNAVKQFVYFKATGALTQYQPYTLTVSTGAAAEITTSSMKTLTGAVTKVVVPQVGFTSGYYGWGQISGSATVKTDAAIASGVFVEVKTSGTAATTTGGSTQTNNSIGVVTTASTGATTAVVLLSGTPVAIQTT